MNSRQRKTLSAIFETPTRADVEWSAIESLLRALGAEIKQGSGSRVRFMLGGDSIVLHEPHPESTLDPAAVKAARTFLVRVGINKEAA